MNLSRWQPLLAGEVSRLHNQMDHLFNRVGLGNFARPALAYSYPPVNVWEDEDNVYAEAELPGLTQEQLQLLVSDGNQLTLQGERRACADLAGTWHRRERGFGKFSRTVELPTAVDAERVEARLEQGVLKVKLPKSAAAKPRKIAIQSQ